MAGWGDYRTGKGQPGEFEALPDEFWGQSPEEREAWMARNYPTIKARRELKGGLYYPSGGAEGGVKVPWDPVTKSGPFTSFFPGTGFGPKATEGDRAYQRVMGKATETAGKLMQLTTSGDLDPLGVVEAARMIAPELFKQADETGAAIEQQGRHRQAMNPEDPNAPLEVPPSTDPEVYDEGSFWGRRKMGGR